MIPLPLNPAGCQLVGLGLLDAMDADCVLLAFSDMYICRVGMATV